MTDNKIVSFVGKEIADALDSRDLEFINITGQILRTKIRPRRKFVSRPMMRRLEEVIGAVRKQAAAIVLNDVMKNFTEGDKANWKQWGKKMRFSFLEEALEEDSDRHLLVKTMTEKQRRQAVNDALSRWP